MKNLTIIFFILFALHKTAVAFCVQDSVKVSIVTAQKSTQDASSDNVTLNLRPQALLPVIRVQPFLSDKFGLVLKQTFKYDTTWSNPDHRCYEIKKPITQKYLFLFKFISQQQYLP